MGYQFIVLTSAKRQVLSKGDIYFLCNRITNSITNCKEAVTNPMLEVKDGTVRIRALTAMRLRMLTSEFSPFIKIRSKGEKCSK
jgi:hypothetical protein